MKIHFKFSIEIKGAAMFVKMILEGLRMLFM